MKNVTNIHTFIIHTESKIIAENIFSYALASNELE